ncbi:hypothetical protein Pla175_01440 [Pirellulimonas nuda]|uniref:Uncharacterized protein n=1 Tax=Pirellulimonas nuda TaxID=2528009 RepID=A0A518D5N6_9BACT|nr:hypothetical protein Pla175_01440 [Pirellulimonas nuda]
MVQSGGLGPVVEQLREALTPEQIRELIVSLVQGG